MTVIRLILLVVILGGLTLLLTQNWSPVISLVFLGMRTQPLPLAMWMLLATSAGALTSLLITSLMTVSTYFVTEQRQTRFKSAARPRTKTTYQQQPTPEPPPVNQTDNRSSDTFDDWNTNNDDDWNFDEKPQETSGSRQQTQEFSESKTYERQQEPKSSSQSGSVYSYNYRDPKNTAVGKTESVYDADYRVIIPPYQPPTTNQADDDDDDDWSFFDDEDSEDERPRR